MNYNIFLKKINDFLNFIEIEKNLSNNTCRAYDSDLKNFKIFWFNLNKKLKKKLKLKDAFNEYLANLYNENIEKSSISRKISCLKSFEKHFKSNNKNQKVTNLNLIKPKINKKLPIFLSPEEIKYLLDDLENEKLNSARPIRDKTILEILYSTGIRCSELINIKISEINFSEKTILIMGKGNKERLVLFGNYCKLKIEEYIEKERTIDLKNKNTNYLLLNTNGGNLTQRTIQRILNNFSKFLKSKKEITPHKIRHTFATHLLNKGIDLRSLQELLGHSSLGTTENYTHISKSELKNIYDTIHPINFWNKK